MSRKAKVKSLSVATINGALQHLSSRIATLESGGGGGGASLSANNVWTGYNTFESTDTSTGLYIGKGTTYLSLESYGPDYDGFENSINIVGNSTNTFQAAFATSNGAYSFFSEAANYLTGVSMSSQATNFAMTLYGEDHPTETGDLITEITSHGVKYIYASTTGITFTDTLIDRGFYFESRYTQFYSPDGGEVQVDVVSSTSTEDAKFNVLSNTAMVSLISYGSAHASKANRSEIASNGSGGLHFSSTNGIHYPISTAPANASATGTVGEVRYTADHIYVCVATNTWKRVALATW